MYFPASLVTVLIRRMSEYSKDEARIRFDEPMEMYGSTIRIFGVEYSNIRIRPNKNAVHCFKFAIGWKRTLTSWKTSTVPASNSILCLQIHRVSFVRRNEDGQ